MNYPHANLLVRRRCPLSGLGQCVGLIHVELFSAKYPSIIILFHYSDDKVLPEEYFAPIYIISFSLEP